MSLVQKSAVVALVFATMAAGGALGCGGLFCQSVPVDPQAERIIARVYWGCTETPIRVN